MMQTNFTIFDSFQANSIRRLIQVCPPAYGWIKQGTNTSKVVGFISCETIHMKQFHLFRTKQKVFPLGRGGPVRLDAGQPTIKLT